MKRPYPSRKFNTPANENSPADRTMKPMGVLSGNWKDKYYRINNIISIPCLILLVAFAAIAPSRSLAAGGKDKRAKAQAFTITGDIANMPVHTVVLELLRANDSITIVDSQSSTATGHFEISGAINEPGLYRLHFQTDRFILLSLDKGNIKVTADWPVNDYSVQGSVPSLQLKVLIDSVRNYMAGLNIYNRRLDSVKVTGNPVLIANENKLLQDFNAAFIKKIKQYADTTPYQPNAILAARMINPQDELPYFEAFGKSMQRRFPNTVMTKENAQFLVKMKESIPASVELGAKAADLSVEGPDGKTISLSSLKGKYVLLDFWASWCGPCRAENPNVVAAYKKYKDKNFTILGVSLDSKKDAWLKAIDADGLTWQHVSDLKGWSSPAAAKYSVRSIPANFLIDPKGNIVAKDLRGPALESKLEELLK